MNEEYLELTQEEKIKEDLRNDDYVNDNGWHHISECKICPECGELKFWYLTRNGIDICTECAKEYDKLIETIEEK
jgi:hypothetical protein